ncbi:MAG TPA: AAA family ATPase [Streptosporangiaceae bacterium]|nr:AAA family ATPase [Streptosporangiaceae bacterium]
MGPPVQVRLLGPFEVSTDGRAAGPWPRPSARRLCQRVLIAPGRRISRDLACDDLFPDLDPRSAARAVSKALSMARAALAGTAPGLLAADLTHIWASPSVQLDAEQHEAALGRALRMSPGRARDDLLSVTLAEDGDLLADEPYADWALRPRERLAELRQECRLTLARDRAKGAGQSSAKAVTEAWEDCFEHDPACEEAAAALIRGYAGDGRRELAVRVHERCAAALGELGLRIPASLAEPLAAPPVHAPGQVREEVRTVTILSAEVAAPPELGLEGMRDALAASLTAVVAEAEALGGTVMSLSGSGLQAMFGAPQAHEDDPERAVRAAFRALQAPAQSRLRAGIETGPALLGPIGPGVDYSAVGSVVTTAAALQAAARPGTALIGPATRAAVNHLFTWGETVAVGTLRATSLGGPRPVPAGRHFPLGGQVPLAGRQAELAVLGTALRNLARGRGSVILLTGDPGLGKTRLVYECRKRAPGPLWLEGRATSYAAATPYGLYQQVLASWLRIAPDQPEALLRPALDSVLERAAGAASADLFPPLARMLGLPSGAGRMSPEEQQRATFEAMRKLIERLTAKGPVVLVLEDLHWADPTSLRLTAHLAGLAAARPLLILATSRPGTQLPDDLPVHQLVLAPLPSHAERELAGSFLGATAGPEILDAVLDGTEGNPLYLEERLASLVETRALTRDDDMWQLREDAPAQLPQVLERLVRSRVDRLSPYAREAIRAAAVIGVEFSLPLLTAVCDSATAQVIEELCARDLIRQLPSGVSYRFRHAMIQEAVYGGLLSAELRLLHGRVAWTLEERSAGCLAEVAAILGTHFAMARESERAVCYLQQAADQATDAFANTEAIASYRRALALLDSGTEAARLNAKLANVLWRTARRAEARDAFAAGLRQVDEADVVFRAHLLTRLGRLEMVENRGAVAMRAFDDAEALLAPLIAALLAGDVAAADDETAEQWLELMVDGRADLLAISGQEDLALATLRAVQPVLEVRGSPARKSSFYHVRATARILRNRYRVGEADIEDLKLAAAAAAGSEEKDLAYAMFFVGWGLLLHDDLTAARDYLEQSLTLAERIGEAVLVGECLVNLGITAVRRHDTEAVGSLVDRAQAAAIPTSGLGLPAEASACLVWLAWQDGRPAEVIALAARIAAGDRTTYHVPDGRSPHDWVYLLPLIATHLDAGNVEAAVAAARRLLDPGQLHLPDPLDAALAAACTAWDHGDPVATASTLKAALIQAGELRYC